VTSDELERPCFICSNARKESTGIYWSDLPKIHTTDEYCGHREPELRQARLQQRRVFVASETYLRTISPARVA
jgi:hypothetical protein